MYEQFVNEHFIFSEINEKHKIHPQKGKSSTFGCVFFKQKRAKGEKNLPH